MSKNIEKNGTLVYPCWKRELVTNMKLEKSVCSMILIDDRVKIDDR